MRSNKEVECGCMNSGENLHQIVNRAFIIHCWYVYPFKGYMLSDAPTGLTFKNCTFCPHLMCFVFISEQTATSAQYNKN